MQIRGSDLVLSAAGNREVRRAEQFAHLFGQAEFPEMFGCVRFSRINRLAPFLRKKLFRSICRELAPSLRVHLFERLNGPEHRSGSAGTSKFERREEIGQKLAEK